MEAKDWYKVVRSQLTELADEHSVPLEQAIGIFVTFSAQKKFDWNIRQTKQVLAGEQITGMFSQSQARQADLIKSGHDPLSIWGKTASKYRNFYQSLLLQDGAVCIDTHMINAYMRRHPYSILHRTPLEKVFKSTRLYEMIAKWVRKEAKKNDLKTYEMQSVIWVEERGQMF